MRACAVRFVRAREVKQQLDMGHLVLLTGLGFSICGEKVLCNTLDVAVKTATHLGADRLVLLHGPTGSDALLPAVPQVCSQPPLCCQEVWCVTPKGVKPESKGKPDVGERADTGWRERVWVGMWRKEGGMVSRVPCIPSVSQLHWGRS